SRRKARQRGAVGGVDLDDVRAFAPNRGPHLVDAPEQVVTGVVRKRRTADPRNHLRRTGWRPRREDSVVVTSPAKDVGLCRQVTSNASSALRIELRDVENLHRNSWPGEEHTRFFTRRVRRADRSMGPASPYRNP